MEGALSAIRMARERGVPLLGTCGGFQHIISERAGMFEPHRRGARRIRAHASRLLISRLAYSLVVRTMTNHLCSRFDVDYGIHIRFSKKFFQSYNYMYNSGIP